MTKLPSQVLREARALIEPEGAWVKTGDFAQDAKGKYVDANCRSAKAFCMQGAVAAAMKLPFWFADVQMLDPAVNPVGRFLIEACGTRHIGAWNNAPRRKQADALDAFTRAIALAEAEERT